MKKEDFEQEKRSFRTSCSASACDGWFSSDNPPNDSRSILIWTEQGMAEGSYSSGKFLQFRWSCYPNVICWKEFPKPPFAYIADQQWFEQFKKEDKQ